MRHAALLDPIARNVSSSSTNDIINGTNFLFYIFFRKSFNAFGVRPKKTLKPRRFAERVRRTRHGRTDLNPGNPSEDWITFSAWWLHAKPALLISINYSYFFPNNNGAFACLNAKLICQDFYVAFFSTCLIFDVIDIPIYQIRLLYVFNM